MVKMSFETVQIFYFLSSVDSSYNFLRRMLKREAHKTRAEIADAELAEAGNEEDEEEEDEEEDIEYDEGEGVP